MLLFADGIQNRAANFLRRGNFLSERLDHFVEPRANGRVRNACLLGDLFQAAARQQEDLDEPLVLDRQIGQSWRGKRGIDRDSARLTRHAADGHRMAAVGANVGCWHRMADSVLSSWLSH